jgi:hypothetical protein
METIMTIELVSPYAAAKIVNGWLATDGVQKKLPPQMLYMYVSKGYIKSVEMPEGSKCKRMVSEDQLATWYAGYMKKTSPVQVEEVEEIENIEVDGVAIDDEQTVLFS